MEEDRMPKKIFTQELEGTRRRGRPSKRWKEEVERDLQVLGVRRWRELVADRKNGRTLFDRPKPTVGCSANGRRRRRTTTTTTTTTSYQPSYHDCILLATILKSVAAKFGFSPGNRQ
jgi:hypothetical protein